MAGDPAPDALVVSGGGAIAVASTTLFSHAQRLEQLRFDLLDCVRWLETIDRRVVFSTLTAADAPLSAARAEQAIDDARARLETAAGKSGTLAAALRLSADVYGVGEAALARLGQSLAAQFGVGAGYLGAAAAVLLLPGMLAAVASGAAGYGVVHAANPGGARWALDRAIGQIGTWLGGHREILSDPRFVDLVRLSTMSVDDAVGGMLLVPPSVIRVLGDEGLGVTGLDTSAAAAIAVGGAAGALRESRVAVTPVQTAVSTPAGGYADRASRVPRGENKVRIDRHSRPGGVDSFEVYLAGTADFSLRSRDEPFDMTSNLHAMAGGDAGSYRAVTQALAAAGADASSPIVVTGYSQGGLVAAQLAASGDFNVQGVYTLGAPVGQVAVPADIPWVALEHTDDIVPATGGTWAGNDAVLVRREALAGGDGGSDAPLPAHEFDRYRQTAAMAEASDERRLVAADRAFGELGRGAERVESTWYLAERVPHVARRG